MKKKLPRCQGTVPKNEKYLTVEKYVFVVFGSFSEGELKSQKADRDHKNSFAHRLTCNSLMHVGIQLLRPASFSNNMVYASALMF